MSVVRWWAIHMPTPHTNDGVLQTMNTNEGKNGNWSEVKTFLNEIEEGFINGDVTVTDFLGTDYGR